MKTLGIDIGSSNIKFCALDNGIEIWNEVKNHDGNVKDTLLQMLEEKSISNDWLVSLTGVQGRKNINLNSYIEAEAIEYGLNRKKIDCEAVVSLGGESLILYTIKNMIVQATFQGDKCASGTGEFFKQQLLRMDLELNDIEDAGKCGRILKLAHRCSVFMKSDCTHKLNKNEANKADIIVSLSNVMAIKVIEFLIRAKINTGKVLLIGGITKNRYFIELIRKKMPSVDFIIPEEAVYFEAYGAALKAQNSGEKLPLLKDLFKENIFSYNRMQDLTNAMDRVAYLDHPWGKINPEREYILGVDGGSTTTKIVLVDYETRQIVAAHYGRTHGNPVKALKNCIKKVRERIKEQIGDRELKIKLCATTGSSRELLGVFIETPGVYNEIISHAKGATFFKKDIDTIFEIGGQDAKYVYLLNGVPIDYAMNDACSAGTGSFLEESAKGDLNIDAATLIADIALKGKKPLKFGEHCSAFINSDIRKAVQEGAKREDITAGIIYSIIENYLNRVVGNRSIGEHIVLQGGVAKNKAVPLAFATILGKNITVPPDPELLGAFGVALLAREKFESGLLQKGNYSLAKLNNNEISYGKSFTCKSCDNYCPIMTIIVNDHKYFFGGRCNKYTNMRKKIELKDVKDYVEYRSKIIMEKYAPLSDEFISRKVNGRTISVGIPMIFSVFNLWPLYSWFFHKLGVKIYPSEEVKHEGIMKVTSSFCYPGEIAHGTTEDVLQKKVDFIFLPHFRHMETVEKNVHSTLCPVAQALPYYIKIAFKIDDATLLAPIIDFKFGTKSTELEFIRIAHKMGFTTREARSAFRKGYAQYRGSVEELKKESTRLVKEIESGDKIVIGIFGRPYNAFSKDANMGIPIKFTSRGFSIIPYDLIEYDQGEIVYNMYWYYGQQNIRAAHSVKKYKNIFMCYVTNFSCAPDSFILHFMKWIMGTKPYLVLELDSHSADAGIDTRIEAFLDIIEGYRHNIGNIHDKKTESNIIIHNEKPGKGWIELKDTGERVELTDKRVKFIWPSMGRIATEVLAAAARSEGINAISLPIPTLRTTQLAKDVSSGKECIPTLLVLGILLDFMAKNPPKHDDIYIIGLPITTGPCRTGQYAPFYQKTFENAGYRNFAIFPLSSDNSYNDLGQKITMTGWWGFVLGDVLKDIEISLRTIAENKEEALRIFNREYKKVLSVIEKKDKKLLKSTLREMADELKKIPRIAELHDLPKVLIVGEIYVRRDDYSHDEIVSLLAKNGIYVKITPFIEWVHYTSFLKKERFMDELKSHPFFTRIFNKRFWQLIYIRIFEDTFKKYVEHTIEQIFKDTGLIPDYPHDINKIIAYSRKFTVKEFISESTVSSGVGAYAMEEGGFSGVGAIAPFACLPGRLLTTFLQPYFREKGYPFIPLENDGLKYPTNILNNIDIFILNVKRYYNEKIKHRV